MRARFVLQGHVTRGVNGSRKGPVSLHARGGGVVSEVGESRLYKKILK